MIKNLLVLGAGPKSMAIAAKAVALNKMGIPVPKVTIIEKSEFGAHWSGKHGHTSGYHPLGTPPSKDVGFPYFPHFGSSVNKFMISEFSWQAFLTSGKASWMAYGDWIDRGTPHPPHLVWHRYLNWVHERTQTESSIEFILGEVVKLNSVGSKWSVTYKHESGGEKIIDADGVVITGPGELIEINGQPHHQRVMNGKSFWLNKNVLAGATAATLDAPICVVGAGETAASVVTEVNALVDSSNPPRICVVNNNGMIYSRGENYFENSVYTDPDSNNWSSLSLEKRKKFINRTDRGVFSMSSLEVIKHMINVQIIPGRAHEITIDYPEDTPRLIVVDEDSSSTLEIPAAYIIVSIGYDPWTFLNLLDTDLKFQMRTSKHGILDSIKTDLSVDWNALSITTEMPKLHLPMLAGVAQGPGFPNLSSLGTLADRILMHYIDEK